MYVTALLARARIHDPSVVAELQALSANKRVDWRMQAAVALYYLGDDSSAPMIELFRRHAEGEDAALDEHFQTMGPTAEFQQTIAYLRSPKTDALFIERLRHGFGNGDDDLARDGAFLLEHAAEVLPLLVKYLDDRDSVCRSSAASCLGSITGMRVDWDYTATATGNAESKASLKAAADALLAQYCPAATSGPLE